VTRRTLADFLRRSRRLVAVLSAFLMFAVG
jgi:hypothetical protein